MVASYGTCHVIGCAIFALHGGRALGEFGMSRQTHTHAAIFFLHSANLYPSTMKSVDALQTFYVLVFCIIRSWVELLVCMVLFMVFAHWPERFAVYAPVPCHSVGRVVWEEDRQVYMAALYGGDNC